MDSHDPEDAGSQAGSPPAAQQPALDPAAVIRSRPYLAALVLAAVLGIPISAAAYGFLALVSAIQEYLFDDLPQDVFAGDVPAWWPVPWLVLCGLLTGMTIRYLPGNGGHSPAFGFHTGGGPPVDKELPGIVLAALTTLSLGAVLGPEAPLIAIGGGLAALTVHLVKKDAPPMALDDHGVGRQLRCDQHASRLPGARRLPDHGGGRHRGRDPQPGGAAGAVGLRRRRAGLRRPGQLDGPGHASRSPSPPCPQPWIPRWPRWPGRWPWVPEAPCSGG